MGSWPRLRQRFREVWSHPAVSALRDRAADLALDFAQRYVAAIDCTDVATASAHLEETKASVDPLTAERENVVLRLPGRRAPTGTMHL